MRKGGSSKVNVDAAVSVEQNLSGIGIIVRDEEGRFMARKTQVIHGCSDPHGAELYAAREGLLLAWEAGFRRVYLEGDARNVYSLIKEMGEDYSDNGAILRYIIMYASWFDNFDCGYVSRCCNKVADLLAHLAITGDPGIWLEVPPDAIVNILSDDLIH